MRSSDYKSKSFRIFEVVQIATISTFREEDAKSLESVISVTFHNLPAFRNPPGFSLNREAPVSKVFAIVVEEFLPWFLLIINLISFLAILSTLLGLQSIAQYSCTSKVSHLQ